ncbi:MAG: putative RfaH family transcriptional regulator [Chloroflexi bacterium]|jgi:transcriptional antiterminator RfaH|nr:putative RfaH family transcriptional regulator [Chloroflexota bacterium]
MAGLWYALRSKPRKEDIVWRQVTQSGYETFYPRIRVNPVNPRSRKVQPYFPGYLFVLADLDQVGVSTFQWMPHTLGLVSFGGEPAYVPENLIIALRKRVEEIAAAGGELFDGLQPGDPVLINSGPFSGYEAIFDARLPGSERVRVLLEFLGNQRRLTVELNASQIAKKRT